MIFSSLEFVVFYLVIMGGVALLRSNTQRKLLLLIGSWYFYAYWDWRFLSLILLSSITGYFIGNRISLAENAGPRRRWLILSLVINLGILAYFKYFNFFIESLLPIFQVVGIHAGTLDILLPVGISFYTFQTLSYTIDVYRGRMQAHGSLLDFALFVGFFPQLVAGPIVRASHFLPQLAAPIRLTAENGREGFRLFAFGLFKKVFLADRIAMFVDPVFNNITVFDSPTAWLAAVGYTLQIYYDFSGYSDMAIGLARIFGLDLGRNFDFPYLSRSMSEFWRRWHISLSSWVRDYLYIPLGGNRGGLWRTNMNLMITMLVMGLWHGASWTFVAWGGWHGFWQVVERLYGRRIEDGIDRPPSRFIVDGLQWAGCFLITILGWVLFRADSFAGAYAFIHRMVVPTSGVNWISPFTIFVFIGTGLVHWLHVNGASAHFLKRWTRFTPALLFCLLWLVVVFAPQGFTPFIYFQF